MDPRDLNKNGEILEDKYLDRVLKEETSWFIEEINGKNY